MSDTPNEKNFMREKIVKPPIDKRRAAGRILCYVLFAVVFGGVAPLDGLAVRQKNGLGEGPQDP